MLFVYYSNKLKEAKEYKSKSKFSPLNFEKSYVGQSMMAASYLDTTMENIDQSINQSMIKQESMKQNEYETTIKYFNHFKDNFVDYIVCDNEECNYSINVNCKRCCKILDMFEWNLSTQICSCDYENTYYFPMNIFYNIYCRKCSTELDHSQSVTVVKVYLL